MMEYYYTKKANVDIERKELVISDFEFKHLTKVLRKKTGDKLTVTDGEYNIYYCEITKIEKTKLFCRILGSDNYLYEPEINITLYLSPLRNSARFEFAIEKSVELGVKTIQPVITEFTVNKNYFSGTKTDRLNKIIIGAMGQSQRCYLSKLENPISLNELINKTSNGKNKIVMYESSEDKSGITFDRSLKEVSLLIGPEGGFSNEEINLLNKNRWKVKSLGERKLRAETAVIVSIYELLNSLKK